MLQTAIRDKETDSNLYKRLFTNLSLPSHSLPNPVPVSFSVLHTVVNKPNEPCKIDWVVSDVFQVAPGVRRARIRRTFAASPAWLMLAILTPNSGVWRKRFLPVCNRTWRKKHETERGESMHTGHPVLLLCRSNSVPALVSMGPGWDEPPILGLWKFFLHKERLFHVTFNSTQQQKKTLLECLLWIARKLRHRTLNISPWARRACSGQIVLFSITIYALVDIYYAVHGSSRHRFLSGKRKVREKGTRKGKTTFRGQ